MLPDWTGRAVAAIASGPSLTAEDCERVRAAGLATIVTNTSFRLCPWADVLYAFDFKWWRVYREEVELVFRGRRFSQVTFPPPGVESVKGWPGFRSFGNSGATAVSFAILCGAREIVLLGYDCQLTGGRSHHHGDHPP